MRKKIPSLNALIIFEAAARQQSFTRAADELALTQSAVCRQIASLEEWLGLPLFTRIKKRVLLTPAGRDYAQRIRGHLDRIERDTLELMGQQDGAGVLELAVVPTFATQWLIPRLSKFQQQRPDITINLSTKTNPFLFSESLCQAAIHSGQAPWPGTTGDYLMPEDDAIAVCSPAFLRQHRPVPVPFTARDMNQLPLLHLSSRLDDWRRWFDLHDAPQEKANELRSAVLTESQAESNADPASKSRNDIMAVKGARYELFTMLAEAAVAGLGMALIPRYMVQAELNTGRLVCALPLSLPGNAAYYLVYPEENAELGPLAAFKAWLLAESQSYLANSALQHD
ncbi:LysR substrate-binding domain-containing protein [soil metagenome]